jgi:hypothetical protein
MILKSDLEWVQLKFDEKKLNLIHMRNLTIILLITILICSSCGWIRVANKPVFSEVETLPLNIGIRLESNPGSNAYGPLVIKYLDEFKIFNSIIYPYKEGEIVDGILDLKINGHWVKKGAGNLVVLCPVLSPFAGPSMIAKHETEAKLNNNLTKVATYVFQTETKIKHGVMADKKLVVLRGDSLQTYKIAYQIVGKLLMDQDKVMKEFNKQ